MSDCGTVLLVSRKDGGPLDPAARDLIEKFARDRKSNGEFVDGMQNPFAFVVSEAETDDAPSLAIRLSEYWVEDEEQHLFAEEMIEMDKEVVGALAEALRGELGDGWAVEVYAGDW